MVGGEYERADGRPRGGGPVRNLKKDEVIDESNCVIRIHTTRKGTRVRAFEHS